jgi:putative ABC transport system permease protein
MLGIIIGIIAVMFSFAVGAGTQDVVMQQIESLGSNLLTVIPGSTSSHGVNFGFGSAFTLTYTNVQQILTQDPGILFASGVISYNAQVVYGANNTHTSIEGVNASFPIIKNLKMLQGSFFQSQQVNQEATVAVLGSQIEQSLFSGTGVNPVGQIIDIKSIPFTVVGVITTQGESGIQSTDDMIEIPITTEMGLYTHHQNVTQIIASADSFETINQAQQEIEDTLRVAHQLWPGVPNDFKIVNQETIVHTLSTVTMLLTLLLGIMSAITLLVGGIGIMNVMMMSVTERTREIGIRKAVGATNANILSQFLMEALMLSLGGGFLGLIIGTMLVNVTAMWMKLGNLVSPIAVAMSVVFSMMIGIVFGVYPARKAAQLNPIDALRYE